MTPSITVVIPSFNYGRFIGAAVRSVLEQTYAAAEIIVVDDGSSDDTIDVVRRFGDRVHLIQQPNAGVGAARNTGAQAATSTLLAFIDADDEWVPTKLEKQVACFARNPSIALVHCGVVEIDVDGCPGVTTIVGARGRIAKNILMFEPPTIVAPGSTVLVRREVFREVGGFDTRCPPSEDWDFAFSVARRHVVDFVAEPLLRYRQHGRGGHLDISRMERGMLIAFGKAFSIADTELTPLKRAAYGKLYRILAGSYFRAGNWRQAGRCGGIAVAWDPRSILYLSAFPLRWLSRRARKL